MKANALLPLLAAAITPFLVLTLIVTSTGLGLMAWKPFVLWSDTFGPSNGGNSATAIANSSSSIYVQGFLNNSGIGAPGGGGSMFLAKYDPQGARVWTRSFGNTSRSMIDAMSVGPEGIYLSGLTLGGGGVEEKRTEKNS